MRQLKPVVIQFITAGWYYQPAVMSVSDFHSRSQKSSGCDARSGPKKTFRFSLVSLLSSSVNSSCRPRPLSCHFYLSLQTPLSVKLGQQVLQGSSPCTGPRQSINRATSRGIEEPPWCCNGSTSAATSSGGTAAASFAGTRLDSRLVHGSNRSRLYTSIIH